MSAPWWEQADVKAARDDYNAKLTIAGHDVVWKLAPNATRKGWAYYFIGECRNCGGNMHIGSSWSSASSIIDLRHTACAGPGTYVLAEIEQNRQAELLAPAIAEFVTAIQRVRYSTAPLN